jgi:hypothetical protein
LSADIVNDFFDRYEHSAAGVHPDNVFNYDETNLRDNPGKNHNTVTVLRTQNLFFAVFLDQSQGKFSFFSAVLSGSCFGNHFLLSKKLKRL